MNFRDAVQKAWTRWRSPRTVTRMYHAARASRLAGPAPSDSSADQELVTSLTTLRGRSRQLVRDASYAKRARGVVVNNVIGPSGIGVQSQVKNTRDELHKAVNDQIEEEFAEWSCADMCHTGGGLHLIDLERQLMSQVFEAGEIFVRKHFRTFGRSKIPYALEIVEPERIADEVSPGPTRPENMVRMGIEVDPFYRPVGYWMRERHKGEFRLGVSRSDRYEFVPASMVYHLKVATRWPQTRGEPWMNTSIRRLGDMDGYSEAEIVAARAAANYMGFITSEFDPDTPVAGKKEEGGEVVMEMEPGTLKKLGPGEEIAFHTPTRPNAVLDPFMRYMLREVAAGTGVSYASLSMDYSQSNYSSSRLALLDDRDLWRVYQGWIIRSFLLPMYREWLQQAVFAGVLPAVAVQAYASDLRRYERVLFKPRGWSWIDPQAEVDSYVKAVRAGFMTVADVIAITGEGRDLEDLLEGRRKELDSMEEKKLEFDTDPERDAQGKKVVDPADMKPPAAPGAPAVVPGAAPRPKPAAVA